MNRLRRQPRSFTLLGALFAISASAIILSVLGKLLLDGMYLQRIAAERSNRLAVMDSLTERLRADALGATAYAWDEGESTQTLKLCPCADGAQHHVDWIFEGGDVLRRVDGCEAGGFHATRVGLTARVERSARCDVLILDVTVFPPTHSRSPEPRNYAQCVLLPRQMDTSVSTAGEQQP